MLNQGISREEAVINIGLALVLTVITCGIYSLFWNYRQMKICNALLGREDFSFLAVLLLSLITCGLYFIYYEYKMGEAIKEIQRKSNVPVNDSLSLIGLLLSLFGLYFVVDAVYQHELNQLF